MAKTRPEVKEIGGQNIGFLFGTMMDLRMLPTDIKHTGNVEVGEFKMVAHFPAIHERNGTEAQYLAKHRTFRGGLYATYQDGPYKIDEIKWDATNRAGVHMVTKTKYGQIVEFPTQPSKSMPGSMKLMVQEYVESLKQPQLVIRCSGLGGALEPVANTFDEYKVILLNGDIKCPKSMHSHVPAKYHAEDDGRFDAQIGSWSFNAEEIIDGNPGRVWKEMNRKRQVTQVQRVEIVVDVDWETEEKVDTKYRQEIQQWAANEIEEWIDYNYEEIINSGSGSWEEDWDSDDGDTEVRVVFTYDLDDGPYEIGDGEYEDEDYWEYGAENDKHDGFGNYKKPPWVSVGRRTRFMRDKKKRRQMARKQNAEQNFEAASTASPNLSREQDNVLQAVKAQYPGFSWNNCDWGPYFLRFSEDGSNKFYSVWVWESNSGIYTAMGAYGGLGRNPRLFNITQTRNLQQAINEAQKKMNSKTRKGYNTYKAEVFNAQVGPYSCCGEEMPWFDTDGSRYYWHCYVCEKDYDTDEFGNIKGDEFNAPIGFNEMGSRPFYGNPRKIAIDRWGNRRFIRRRKDGTYMKNVDVGRSIAMDRRRQSKTWAPPGYRDQGDGSPSLLERFRFLTE